MFMKILKMMMMMKNDGLKSHLRKKSYPLLIAGEVLVGKV
jgi:hypothetical protein